MLRRKKDVSNWSCRGTHQSPSYIKASLIPRLVYWGCFLPHTGSSMTLTTPLLCAFFLALLSYGLPEASEKRDPSDILRTCNQIAAAISGASQVYFPRKCIILFLYNFRLKMDQASTNYLSDISHASLSSTEASACSVEPGSSEDVSKIVR